MAPAADEDALERLEAEIRDSQFRPWDAEEFLAERHKKRIEAATPPEPFDWRGLLEGTGMAILYFVGVIALITMAFSWLITGSPLPMRQSPEPTQLVLPDGRPNPIPPPKAPALPRSEQPDRSD